MSALPPAAACGPERAVEQLVPHLQAAFGISAAVACSRRSAVKVALERLELQQPGSVSVKDALAALAAADPCSLHAAVFKGSVSGTYQAALHLQCFVAFCKAQSWQPAVPSQLEQQLDAMRLHYLSCKTLKRSAEVPLEWQRQQSPLQQRQQQEQDAVQDSASATGPYQSPHQQQRPAPQLLQPQHEQRGMEIEHGNEQQHAHQVGEAEAFTVNTAKTRTLVAAGCRQWGGCCLAHHGSTGMVTTLSNMTTVGPPGSLGLA